MITVGTAGFLERHITRAEEAGAQAVIVLMNTPGGLVDATLDINRIFRGCLLYTSERGWAGRSGSMRKRL